MNLTNGLTDTQAAGEGLGACLVRRETNKKDIGSRSHIADLVFESSTEDVDSSGVVLLMVNALGMSSTCIESFKLAAS